MIVLSLCPTAASLDLSHSTWRIREGYLPSPPEDITQTKDGYLWIETDAGLLRFDGVRFVPWDSANNGQLPDYQILSLLGASDGSPWIGTAHGLACWKAQTLTTYKEMPDLINAIAEDREGNIWIERSQFEDTRGPLCRISKGHLRCFGRDAGIPLPSATGVAIDSSGNFWVSGNEGLCKWKAGFRPLFSKRNLLPGAISWESLPWSHRVKIISGPDCSSPTAILRFVSLTVEDGNRAICPRAAAPSQA